LVRHGWLGEVWLDAAGQGVADHCRWWSAVGDAGMGWLASDPS